MATATPLTQTAQHINVTVRSIDLAVRDGLDGTVNRRADDPAGRATFTVPSRSYTGVIDRVYVGTSECGWELQRNETGTGDYHLVTWDRFRDHLICTCRAHAYGRPCGHVGAVRLYIERWMRPHPTPAEMMYPPLVPAPAPTPRIVPVLSAPLRFAVCEVCGERGVTEPVRVSDGAGEWEDVYICAEGYGCQLGWLDLTA